MKTKLSIPITLLCAMIICTTKAQWQPTNGPYGHTNNIALPANYDYRGGTMSIEKSGIYLFAGVLGGVMVSTNNGDVWNKSLQVDSAFALKYNGVNLYAGTESGFYLSTNNGTTWTQSNTGLTNLNILSLAVNGTTLYAGTRAGVFISSNNGVSWSYSYIGMPTTSVNAFLVDGTNVFAGTNHGVYLSTDNGLTWTVKNTGLVGIPTITSFTKNGSNIFIGTINYGSNLGYIYLTNNSGNSWTNVSIGFPITYGNSIVSSIGTKIFLGSGIIYESIGNGATWTTNNNSFGGITTFFTDGVNLYDGGRDGISVTTDNGIHWSNLGLGSANSVNSLTSNSTKIFAATHSGIYSSSDNGNTWEKSLRARRAWYTGLTPFNAIVANDSVVYAGSETGYCCYRSLDNGINWTKIINDTVTGTLDTTILSLEIWGSRVFAGTYKGIYSSSDNGNNWIRVFGSLPVDSLHRCIYDLNASGPVIFAATNGGVYLSTDGITWTYANTAGTALGSNGANIFSNNGAISNNYGSTWSAPSSMLNGTIDITVKGDTIIGVYPSAFTGAVISNDNGITWHNVSFGIQDCYYMASCLIKGSAAFVGSGDHYGTYFEGCNLQNNGVFRAGIASLTAGIENSQEYQTLSIYPNPTNSNLTIKANQKLIGCSFSILDMPGRTLIKGKLTNETLNLSVDALSSGLYLFQIDGQKSKSLKFIKN